MSKIFYTIETGFIDEYGNEHVDEFIDAGDDLEMQCERYIDLELPAIREGFEAEGVIAGNVFKRLSAERQSEPDYYIEGLVTLDFESEDSPHVPPLTCAADLGDLDPVIAELGECDPIQ